ATVTISAMAIGGVDAANVVNDSSPISVVAFVPCANGGAGELVAINGYAHTLTNVTISNSSPPTVHLKVFRQSQGVSGTGLTTGDKYQVTHVIQTEQNFDGPLPSTFTFLNNLLIVGPGPGNNLLLHENVHVTVNANGDVTATHDNLSVDCT